MLSSENDTLEGLIDGMQNQMLEGIHTLALGKIASVDNVNMRANVYLLENIQHNDNFYESATIMDCPIIAQSGGGFQIRVPYQVGDKVIVGFCESNIADILESGDRTNQTLKHRFTQDDAVVLGGWNSNSEAGISEYTDGLVLINNKTGTMITITASGEVVIKSNSNVTIESPTTTINGDLNVSGNITAPEVIINGINHSEHVHSGVTAGDAKTQKPE